MDHETIGDRIRLLREERSLSRRFTQADLAKVMGVSAKQVSKWETGQVQLNAEKIRELAAFFGVSVDYLMQGGRVEYLVMMNETGLSDQTISRMRANKEKGKTELAEMINLLSDTRLSPHELLPTSGELLLSAIYDFIHCDERAVYKSPSEGGQYISGLDDLYLLRIIRGLQDLRRDYQETRGKGQDQKKGSEGQEREVIFLERDHLF